MRHWLLIGLLGFVPALAGCCGGGANYFAVAKSQDTNAVSIAHFHVVNFFGSQMLVCGRYDLFLSQQAQDAEIRVTGSGGSTSGSTGSGSTSGTGGSGSRSS